MRILLAICNNTFEAQPLPSKQHRCDDHRRTPPAQSKQMPLKQQHLFFSSNSTNKNWRFPIPTLWENNDRGIFMIWSQIRRVSISWLWTPCFPPETMGALERMRWALHGSASYPASLSLTNSLDEAQVSRGMVMVSDMPLFQGYSYQWKQGKVLPWR